MGLTLFGKDKGVFLYMPRMMLFLVLLCLIGFLLPAYVLSTANAENFLQFFGFSAKKISSSVYNKYLGYLSYVSYSFLHVSWSHLLLNLAAMLAFGTPLLRKLRGLSFLLFWIASASICVGLHYLLFPKQSYLVIGASGVVSAMIGASARFGLWLGLTPKQQASKQLLPIKTVFTEKGLFSFILVWFTLNLLSVLMNIHPLSSHVNIAWDMHLIGFLFGLLFIRPFT